MRRVYRTPRTTVERRPSSPSVSRTLPCASHQPRPTPCRAYRTERLARAPSRRHPAPPCPWRPSPPKGGPVPLDLEDALSSNRTPDPTPHEAGWRSNPSRSSTWSPVAGWTPTRLTLASRTGFVNRSFARSSSVVGPPVARWAGSLGISSLVETTRRCEPLAVLAYTRFGSDPFEPGGPTRASPRARRPVTGTPTRPRTPRDSRRGGHRPALSRARRAFARRGVPRTASFRRPSSEPLRARSKSGVGPPVARWAGSHGISSLVDSARRCERRAARAYTPFGPDPLEPGDLRALHPG
jgi:hypothetical protein